MSSRKGIEISPKYGLNPTIPICFWCGREKQEIALMGRIRKEEKVQTAWGSYKTSKRGDYEAPKHAVLDYTPCEECQKNMSLGVTIMEGSDTPIHENQPAFQEGVYPTGRFVVVTPECVKRVFDIDMQNGQKFFVDPALFQQLFTGVNE